MKKINFLLFFFFNLSYIHAQKSTFYKDVAPIIYNKCASCHRAGEAGPFSLTSYEDVVKRASFIKKVVSSGYMPPWKADGHYTAVPFQGNRSLTILEKKTIIDWIDDKMPIGSPNNLTASILTKYQQGTNYKRKPDAVLSMPKTFQIQGDNKERFIVFKIPYQFDQLQNVEAIEFVSKNRKVIHHANFAIYDVTNNIPLDKSPDYINTTVGETDANFSAYEIYKSNMIYYGGWIPGTNYESYPKNIGWVMPKRGVILLTIHYAPTGKDEEDLSSINFFFTKSPIERVIDVINLGSGGIAEEEITPYFMIPADSIRTFKLKIINPEKQSILGVWPHMHLLGKNFKAYAITPEKDTLKLISIPKWDFNWQELYKYQKPLIIPKGSYLVIEGTYDNSKDNPKNLFNPPRNIYGGGEMKSIDEMLTLIILYLPYKEGDEELPVLER
jgi:hypothetical protein